MRNSPTANAIQRHAIQVEREAIQLIYLDRWRRLIADLIDNAIFGGFILEVILECWLLPKCGGGIGHLIMGARVADYRSGGPVSKRQAVRRSCLFLLDMLIVPAIVNAVMVLTRADRRHLYDLMAGTVVVHDPRSFGERWSQATADNAAYQQR